MQVSIHLFSDTKTIDKYRNLRWRTFRKESNLPKGSELYDGEDKGIYIGAFIKNEFVGGVFLLDRGNNLSQMHQIVVEKNFRNHGIGTHLIERATKEAKLQGIEILYANAKVTLHEFYSKRGFIIIPKNEIVPENFSRRHKPGIPYQFMKKICNSNILDLAIHFKETDTFVNE